MKTLTEIHQELNLCHPPFNCDKNLTAHNYLPLLYDKIFPEYKEKNIRILEIGVQFGGSLKLWSEYFINGQIYGIDIFDSRCEEAKNLKNTTYILGDAYTQEMTNSLPTFDIIVDDGSHHGGHQEFVIEHYKKLLTPTGVMVIEDVGNKEGLASLVEFSKKQNYSTIIPYDLIHTNGRVDNILLELRV